MATGRRGFLIGASAAAIAVAAGLGRVAFAATGGRSVTEFGVNPSGGADQTKALQKAIDEITAAGEIILIPGGVYQTGSLRLPARCAIAGVPGLTRLAAKPSQPIFEAGENLSLSLSGLALDGGVDRAGRDIPLVSVKQGALVMSGCNFERCAIGVLADGVEGMIEGVTASACHGSAIRAVNARSLSVNRCVIKDCQTAGIDVVTGEDASQGCIISDNQIAGCATGINVKGSGNVSGNFVSGASKFGIRLGGGPESGAISAISNTMSDCAIGIGIAAGGETLLVSLNLIMRAKSGAIRAFDGEKIVGPDLTQKSAESYLNLTVVGNVSR